MDYKISNGMDFSTYLVKIRQVVKEGRVTPNRKVGNDLTEVDINSPFEWKTSGFDRCASEKKTGLLLIHGLTDSPFSMRDMGASFSENPCLLIRSILLPGHGTVPGDLSVVKYQDWVAATNWAIASFNKKVAGLYVAGYSTGGALAINHALDNPSGSNPNIFPKVLGLLLFSPGVATSKIAFLTPFLSTQKVWLDKAKDLDYSKYESFPTNAAAQFYHITMELKKKFKKKKLVSVPVFIAVSFDDATVLSSATYHFFKWNLTTVADKGSKMLVFTRKEKMGNKSTVDTCEYIKLDTSAFQSDWTNIDCIESDNHPGVKSSSHLAIPNSPRNFHYGRNGDYPSCGHYESGSGNSEKCLSNSDGAVVWAEKNIISEESGVLFRRATFNPDFDRMISEAKTFMNNNARN